MLKQICYKHSLHWFNSRWPQHWFICSQSHCTCSQGCIMQHFTCSMCSLSWLYRLWGLGWSYHFIVLCNAGLWYDRITGCKTNLVCTQHCSPLFFESHLLGTTNNHTFCLSSSERQPMEKTSLHTFPFPSRLITVVFEDFESCECPWDVETSMVQISCWFHISRNVGCVLGLVYV